MVKVTVDWNLDRQPIDGFGVCGAFMQARNLQQYPLEDRTRILDALFSQDTGAGISIIRNIVGDSGVWGNQEDGPTPSIMPKKDEINVTGDEDQIWFMGEAAQRGCKRFISTVWSPPAWMKTNHTVTSGGELKKEYYADFANYLAEYIKIYKEKHKIDICAISPANEPDYGTTYSSSLWTGAQFADFYQNYLEPVFQSRGLTTKTFGPEVIQFGNASLQKYADMFRREKGLPDIVAMHGYENSVIEPLDSKLVGHRNIWMTELCDIERDKTKGCDPSIEEGLGVARNVHKYLTTVGCNAYVYFWGMSKYDNNSALVHLDLENKSYILCKRLYTFGQYSRFIRPGYVRISAEHDGGEDVLISAYKGDGNKLVIVALNMRNTDCACTIQGVGFSASRLTPYTTDRDRNLSRGEAVQSDGGLFRLTLSAKSLVTFTAQTDKLAVE